MQRGGTITVHVGFEVSIDRHRGSHRWFAWRSAELAGWPLAKTFISSPTERGDSSHNKKLEDLRQHLTTIELIIFLSPDKLKEQ